jgi:hypothetical protein
MVDNVLDKCLGATLHCGVMLKNITLNGREDFIDFVLLCGANEYILSLNLAFSIFFLYLCALNYIVLLYPIIKYEYENQHEIKFQIYDKETFTQPNACFYGQHGACVCQEQCDVARQGRCDANS